jgi:hypothetical protein
MKTPGQLDYERDVQQKPLYHTGHPRKTWAELSELTRWSWERGATINRPTSPITLVLLFLFTLSACTTLPGKEPGPATMLYVDCGGHPTHIPLSQYRNQPRCVQI